MEDWLAAGAILRGLPGRKSPEAAAAIAAFESGQHILLDLLASTGSGRELIARGFAADVELAAHVDVSDHVPRLDRDAFIELRRTAV